MSTDSQKGIEYLVAKTRQELRIKINDIMNNDSRWRLVSTHEETMHYVAWLEFDPS